MARVVSDIIAIPIVHTRVCRETNLSPTNLRSPPRIMTEQMATVRVVTLAPRLKNTKSRHFSVNLKTLFGPDGLAGVHQVR